MDSPLLISFILRAKFYQNTKNESAIRIKRDKILINLQNVHILIDEFFNRRKLESESEKEIFLIKYLHFLKVSMGNPKLQNLF